MIQLVRDTLYSISISGWFYNKKKLIEKHYVETKRCQGAKHFYYQLSMKKNSFAPWQPRFRSYNFSFLSTFFSIDMLIYLALIISIVISSQIFFGAGDFWYAPYVQYECVHASLRIPIPNRISLISRSGDEGIICGDHKRMRISMRRQGKGVSPD